MKLKKRGNPKVSSKIKVPSVSQRSMKLSKDAKNHTMVERASQKVIVPCHDRLEILEAWAPGDVVEVFDKFSWKMATVSEVLGKMYILVRLLGSSQGFKVRKSDIRARQSCPDDAWDMVGRGSNDCTGGKLRTNLILNQSPNLSSQVQKTNSRTNLLEKDNCSAIRDKGFQESHNTRVRILKRPINCRSKEFDGAGHKVRVIVKQGRYLRMDAAKPSQLPSQVNAVFHPRDSLGDSHRPASLNHRLGGHLEMDVKGKKAAGTVRESNDLDSISCSVGSCSVIGDNSSGLPCDISTAVAEHIAGQFFDNGSPHHLECEAHCPSTNKELAAEIHRLELHAYRCTIEALHASGPLSWEQEVLITNLRLSLNISNDEHLLQLKHLISADTRIPIK